VKLLNVQLLSPCNANFRNIDMRKKRDNPIPNSTDNATYGASILLQKRIQSEIRQGSLTCDVQAYVTSEGQVVLDDPGWRGILSYSCHFGYLMSSFPYNLN